VTQSQSSSTKKVISIIKASSLQVVALHALTILDKWFSLESLKSVIWEVKMKT
jgi:hypothetical protein